MTDLENGMCSQSCIRNWIYRSCLKVLLKLYSLKIYDYTIPIETHYIGLIALALIMGSSLDPQNNTQCYVIVESPLTREIVIKL